ncbi:transporter [bacterium]|nr:transporter [bacterium]MBU1651070.1 transporter [bacterium]
MKRLMTILLLITFVGVMAAPADAQVLWRSAKTMKQGSYIAMTNLYYQDITKVWDFTENEWCDCNYTKTEWGANTMIGYAVTDRMEVMAHIPFRYINYQPENGESVDRSGVGDIWLKSRIAVFPWEKNKHGFTVTSTLSLPTGSVERGLGSGRIKYALGGIYSSKWFGKYRGHLKLNYWWDQKGWATGSSSSPTKDIGDNMKFIAKNDYNFSKKWMGFATYIYTVKWANYLSDGSLQENSHQTRHIAQVGAVYKPYSGWFIRPKVAFIMGGVGGTKWDYKPMIDLWYVFNTGV